MKYSNKYREWKPLTLKEFIVGIRETYMAKRFIMNNNIDELLNKPRIQIVGLHHLFDDKIENFRTVLEILSKNFEFISYSEAVNRILTSKIDKPYMAFTCDDGLKNNLNLSQILKEFNVSGCFFLVTSMIGEKDFAKVSQFSKKILNKSPSEFLDFSDIGMLLKDGHEIGSHSVTHPNFAEIDLNIIKKELHDSLDFLTHYFGNINHFAWPYGGNRHFSEAAKKAVFEVGYSSCVSIESGFHEKGIKNYKDLILKRTHIDPAFRRYYVKYLLTRQY